MISDLWRGMLAIPVLDQIAFFNLVVAIIEVLMAVLMMRFMVKRFYAMKAILDTYAKVLEQGRVSVERLVAARTQASSPAAFAPAKMENLTWRSLDEEHWVLMGHPVSIRLSRLAHPRAYRLVEEGKDDRGFDTLEEAMLAGCFAAVQRVIVNDE